MAKIKTSLGIGALGLSGLLIIWGIFTYQPPLLDQGGRNPAERIHDFFAYSWYLSKSIWLENTRRAGVAELEKARAAWFRPERLKSLLGVTSRDPYELGVEFEKRGLLQPAARLFNRACRQSPDDPALLRRVLSYCQSLGQWEEIIKITRKLPPPVMKRVKGYYWRGRSFLELKKDEEAFPILQKAVSQYPRLADGYYQLGRVYLRRGNLPKARAEFLRAVQLLPSHLSALRSLARIYEREGEEEKWKEIGHKMAEFSPPTPARGNFSNRILVLGFDLPSSRLRGEEEVRLTMYYRVPGPDRSPLEANLVLKAANNRVLRQSRTLPAQGWEPGGIKTMEWKFEVSPDACPGVYQIQAGFSGEDKGLLHQVGSGKEYVIPGEVEILAGVFDLPYPEKELKTLFGDQVIDLRKTSTLGGHYEVSQLIEPRRPVSALGILSYTQNSISIPQGTEIARIEVSTDSEGSRRFPIRMGLETADLLLANRAPEERRHKSAQVYRTRRIKSKGKTVVVNVYYSLFRFPEPVEPRKVKIEYTYPSAGCLFIKDIFLLPGS